MIPFNPMGFAKRPAAAPPAGLSVGRSASAGVAGAGGNFNIGFTGGAAASGVWVVCFSLDNEYAGTGLAVPSGGSAWTRVGTSRLWYKQCGGSEPANYTISYSGGYKGDYCSASIVEILNSSGVDGTPAASTGSATSPSPGTSTDANGICVIGVGDGYSDQTGTPPTGYTLQTSRAASSSSALATKTGVGTGAINPGAWTGMSPGATWAKLASILFKG